MYINYLKTIYADDFWQGLRAINTEVVNMLFYTVPYIILSWVQKILPYPIKAKEREF